MPNADIDRTRVAPLIASIASVDALHTSWKGTRRHLAGGRNISNVRSDDVEEEAWKVTSDEALFKEWGETQSNPDSYLRRIEARKSDTDTLMAWPCKRCIPTHSPAAEQTARGFSNTFIVRRHPFMLISSLVQGDLLL